MRRNILMLLSVFVLFSGTLQAQENTVATGRVFLKNALLPGWGYAEIDGYMSTRARNYMIADLAIVGTWLGLRRHQSALSDNVFAYAQSRAGIDLVGVDRRLLIAVGNYENLPAYNEEQLRLRNWNNVLSATSENQWQWSAESERARFNDLRDRQARLEQQIPAVAALLVVNRLVAAVGAFRSAQQVNNPVTTHFSVVPNALGGFSSALNIAF